MKEAVLPQDSLFAKNTSVCKVLVTRCVLNYRRVFLPTFVLL